MISERVGQICRNSHCVSVNFELPLYNHLKLEIVRNFKLPILGELTYRSDRTIGDYLRSEFDGIVKNS